MKLIWLANPYSPHVRHWYEIYKNLNPKLELKIYHIGHKNKIMECFFDNDVKIINVIPTMLNHILPEVVQYCILGIYLLFNGEKDSIYHAHSSGGYGLSAAISKKNFILTTYGSEIYAVKNKSWLYKSLINIILSRAFLITSASPMMTKFLCHHFPLIKTKIKSFSLGVSKEFNFNCDKAKSIKNKHKIPNNAFVFCSNRKISPLYRTKEIIEAFDRLTKNDNLDVYLILISGDYNEKYKKEVLSDINNNRILVIDDFLNQTELSHYLSASDVIISIPKSDQLSSSILEGMMCNSIPVLSKLDAYSELESVAFYLDDSATVDNIYKIIKELVNYDKYKINLIKTNVKSEIKKYSIESVVEIYASVLKKFIIDKL